MLKRYVLGVLFLLSLSMTLVAASSDKKIFVSYIPMNQGGGASVDSYIVEGNIFEKTTVKIGYSNYNLDDTLLGASSSSIQARGFDFSFAEYNDSLFIGPYQRLGLRYADVTAKDSSTDLTVRGFLPYVLVGYNFGFFDSVVLGAGIGAGYSLLEATGDGTLYSSEKGIALVADFTLGFIF